MMPLLDHFRPPLHGPRRREGFHHAWATFLAQQLNTGVLPANYFAEFEVSLGPELEVDVASMEFGELGTIENGSATTTATWAPPAAVLSTNVDFASLETCEVRVYQDLGGAELRGAIELVSPANKDRPRSRRTFAAKCADYLRRGIGVIVVDIVTVRTANLHEEIWQLLESPDEAWSSPSGLSAVAYRAVTLQNAPRVEAWPERLAVHERLPTLPLWLNVDLSVPVDLESSYQESCRALRIDDDRTG